MTDADHVRTPSSVKEGGAWAVVGRRSPVVAGCSSPATTDD
jgi:hypothetical protein